MYKYILFIHIYIYIYIDIYINTSFIVLFAMLRTLFIYVLFSVRYGQKYFFSMVGKSFDSVVRLKFIFLFIYVISYKLFFLKIYLN